MEAPEPLRGGSVKDPADLYIAPFWLHHHTSCHTHSIHTKSAC